MSITGEGRGMPVKVGVAIADIVCGMYAATAILAALRHRDAKGIGQMIDLSLLDAQISLLANEGTNYLLSKKLPQRRGNSHPNVVPYQVFSASDGYFVLAIGNNSQFFKFCEFAGVPELAKDTRFKDNSHRVINRDLLIAKINDLTNLMTVAEWTAGLAALGVPAGPINNIQEALENPQVKHRNGVIKMDYLSSNSKNVELLGNPIKLSSTPVSYRHPPPYLSQHTQEVLKEILELDEDELGQLTKEKII